MIFKEILKFYNIVIKDQYHNVVVNETLKFFISSLKFLPLSSVFMYLFIIIINIYLKLDIEYNVNV